MSHLQSNQTQIEPDYTVVQVNNSTNSTPGRNKIQEQWSKNGRIKFVIVALGIFISYLLVGILQEEILKSRYGVEEERFTYVNTLVEVSLVSGFFFVNIWILFQPVEKDTTPFGNYVACAIANIGEMITSYMALRWVSYPTEVIFKSGKPISVMLFGLFICKRYTIQRYFFVFIIVIGVIIFKLYEPIKENSPKPTPPPPDMNSTSIPPLESKGSDLNSLSFENQQLLGIGLLCFSLAMDGILGMFQDKIRGAHKPTPQQMMRSMSAWASGILLIVLIGTAELFKVYGFAGRHPEVLWQMAVFGLASAIGQIFIYTMVSSFGSLATSVTTTVRKFFSVVCSIVFFGHASTLIQWIGVALVFSALLGDAFFGKKELKICGKQEKLDHELTISPSNAETKEIDSQRIGQEAV